MSVGKEALDQGNAGRSDARGLTVHLCEGSGVIEGSLLQNRALHYAADRAMVKEAGSGNPRSRPRRSAPRTRLRALSPLDGDPRSFQRPSEDASASRPLKKRAPLIDAVAHHESSARAKDRTDVAHVPGPGRPGHRPSRTRLRVHAWVELAQPLAFAAHRRLRAHRTVAPRLHEPLLERAGAAPGGIYGRLTIARSTRPSSAATSTPAVAGLARELAQALVDRDRLRRRCACEGHNPGATSAASSSMPRPAGRTGGSAGRVPRLPAGRRPDECPPALAAHAIVRSRSTTQPSRASSRPMHAYVELAGEVSAALAETGLAAFRIECLRPVGDAGLRGPHYYERYGSGRSSPGTTSECCAMAKHFSAARAALSPPDRATAYGWSTHPDHQQHPRNCAPVPSSTCAIWRPPPRTRTHADAYSTELGDVGMRAARRDRPVIDDLGGARAGLRLIHGQHHLETMTALLRSPACRRSTFVTDGYPWQEARPALLASSVTWPSTPRVPQPARLRARHLRGGGCESCSTSSTWSASLPRPPPRAPARALVFSNAASERTHVGVLREACARRASRSTCRPRRGQPSSSPRRC